jgi:hypothetical protein
MDAQVLNEGRHQGGRAPYGYVVTDGGAHPNPRKAAEGYRLRILAVEEPSADVVRRIFAEYLDGNGDRAIASGWHADAASPYPVSGSGRDGLVEVTGRGPSPRRLPVTTWGPQPAEVISVGSLG